MQKHLTNNDFFESEIVKKSDYNQKQFNELIKPLIDKTIVCCKNALKDAELQKAI